MNQLVTSLSRKTRSKFQKLWQQAEKLRQQNARFQMEFEALIIQVTATIHPAERDAISTEKPLLHTLLTLGQRKSLAAWQRDVLHDWIHELVAELRGFGLIDQNLIEDIARYDAFRLGVALDDDDIATPSEQLIEAIGQQEMDEATEFEAVEENCKDTLRRQKQTALDEAEQMVEDMLDAQLGPEPIAPKKHSGVNADFWQNELDEALIAQKHEYSQRRTKLRKQLLAQLLQEINEQFADEQSNLDEDLHFGTEGDEEADESFPNTPQLDNQVLQRLFRATAAKLHPDREPDAAVQKEKQALMSTLLSARKSGDILTVMELYQQYADSDDDFTKADEKILLASLEQQIQKLGLEREALIDQSQLHRSTYDRFYYSSKRKRDKAIESHLQQVAEDKAEIENMATEIRSLKTLKPWLEERYEENNLLGSLGGLVEMFENMTRQESAR